MLIEFIRQNRGTVSIESFMQAALYHQDFGYYSSRIRGLGRRGDFSTTATFHPALGRAIAKWLTSSRKAILLGKGWHVIEVGGGDGNLAKTVLENLSWWKRKNLHYHLVEVSGTLRQQQQELLHQYNIDWHESMENALAAARGSALIFSNELVDAFPCLQLIRLNGQWKEVCLTLRGEELFEDYLVNSQNLNRASKSSTIINSDAMADGQRCEVHVSYRDWLLSWVPHWKRGQMLTIDYGDIFPTLYHKRVHGTLRGYYQHVRMEGHEIYQRFGKQDLTADINFSDLITWGEELGLQSHTFMTQREFILNWQPIFAKLEKDDPALAFIIHPEGLGTDFKVLLQGPVR